MRTWTSFGGHYSAYHKGQTASLFFFFLIDVKLIYSVALVSAVQQSESVIRIHISTFFRFFSHIGHYRVLSRVPCVYSRSLLVIYFIYSSVYMSIPISQFILSLLTTLPHAMIFCYLRKNKPLWNIFLFWIKI